MPLQIDRRLNLVVPVDTGSGEIYVHSVPISRVVFERYFEEMSVAFARIYTAGHTPATASRVGAMMLRKIARESGTLDGPEGIEKGLFGEIRRLTNLVLPAAALPAPAGALPAVGWTTVPYEDAVRLGYVSEDDAAEVENILAFFTVASALHNRTELPEVLRMMSRSCGGQCTPLNCTDFAAGLTTSTSAENSGGPEKGALPVPPPAARRSLIPS